MTRQEFAEHVESAYRRIRRDIVPTPLAPSPALPRAAGIDVRIKWECRQTTGALALAGLMTERERFRGRRVVLVVSGRNGAPAKPS
jgi:threonine dehydratase